MHLIQLESRGEKWLDSTSTIGLDCWFTRISLVLNIAHRFYTYLNSILELGANVPLARTKGELPKQIGCLSLSLYFSIN